MDIMNLYNLRVSMVFHGNNVKGLLKCTINLYFITIIQQKVVLPYVYLALNQTMKIMNMILLAIR